MARKHAPEQVIAKFLLGQKMLNNGSAMIEVVKELQVTEATWYRWLNQYGTEGKAQATKQVKDLEKTPGLRSCWLTRSLRTIF